MYKGEFIAAGVCLALFVLVALCVFGYEACTASIKCDNLGATHVSSWPNCVCERDGHRFQCDRADTD